TWCAAVHFDGEDRARTTRDDGHHAAGFVVLVGVARLKRRALNDRAGYLQAHLEAPPPLAQHGESHVAARGEQAVRHAADEVRAAEPANRLVQPARRVAGGGDRPGASRRTAAGAS